MTIDPCAVHVPPIKMQPPAEDKLLSRVACLIISFTAAAAAGLGEGREGSALARYAAYPTTRFSVPSDRYQLPPVVRMIASVVSVTSSTRSSWSSLLSWGIVKVISEIEAS